MDDEQLNSVGLTTKLTPRSVTVLRLAQEIAGCHGHAFIGTEHLLLALIEEGEGIAGQVLHEIGAADEARRRTEDE